jgi:hypothetical protein
MMLLIWMHCHWSKGRDVDLHTAKTLSDIRYLMNYVESKIREARQWTEEHNPTTVTEMNHAVEEHFVIRADGRNHLRRDSQIKWSTIVLFLHKRARQQAANVND